MDYPEGPADRGKTVIRSKFARSFLFLRGEEKSVCGLNWKMDTRSLDSRFRRVDACNREIERTWGLGDDRKCKFDVRHVILKVGGMFHWYLHVRIYILIGVLTIIITHVGIKYFARDCVSRRIEI